MAKFIRVIFLFFLTSVSVNRNGPVFSQESQPLSVTVDTFTVQASRFLAGKVDSALLFLVAKAVVEGDSGKHGWLLHASPIEMRTEEHYRFFPDVRFFRFFTPNYRASPGHTVAIDREREKAYLLYQSGAADDLGELARSRGIKLDSDSAAFEYFLEVMQIRGYLPVIILDTIAEIRQFCRYWERSAALSTSELPPVERIHRHLWKSPAFSAFKKGKLPEERDRRCRALENARAGVVRPPAVGFQKGHYSITLYFARTSKLFEIYKLFGIVSPEGLVGYTVKKLE